MIDDNGESEILEWVRTQKTADVSGSLKTLVTWTQQHELRHADFESATRGEVRGISLRVGALEKETDKAVRKIEASGSWDLQAARATASWWRDKVTTILVGIAMLVIGGAVTAAFSHFH